MFVYIYFSLLFYKKSQVFFFFFFFFGGGGGGGLKGVIDFFKYVLYTIIFFLKKAI